MLLKRGFDLIVAAILIVAFSWLFFLIAVAVLLALCARVVRVDDVDRVLRVAETCRADLLVILGRDHPTNERRPVKSE